MCLYFIVIFSLYLFYSKIIISYFYFILGVVPKPPGKVEEEEEDDQCVPYPRLSPPLSRSVAVRGYERHPLRVPPVRYPLDRYDPPDVSDDRGGFDSPAHPPPPGHRAVPAHPRLHGWAGQPLPRESRERGGRRRRLNVLLALYDVIVRLPALEYVTARDDTVVADAVQHAGDGRNLEGNEHRATQTKGHGTHCLHVRLQIKSIFSHQNSLDNHRRWYCSPSKLHRNSTTRGGISHQLDCICTHER